MKFRDKSGLRVVNFSIWGWKFGDKNGFWVVIFYVLGVKFGDSNNQNGVSGATTNCLHHFTSAASSEQISDRKGRAGLCICYTHLGYFSQPKKVQTVSED